MILLNKPLTFLGGLVISASTWTTCFRLWHHWILWEEGYRKVINKLKLIHQNVASFSTILSQLLVRNATGFFLRPLKTSRSQSFFERDQWHDWHDKDQV